MDTLQWTRLMLNVCGCSLELHTYTPLRRFLYKIYTIWGKILLYGIFTLQILDLVLVVENREEFMKNIAYTTIWFNALVKNAMMSMYRANILILLKRLEENYFLPVTKQEMEIRSRFDKLIELSSKAYTAVLAFFLSCILTAVFFIGFAKRMLVCRLWLPYNYTSTNLYIVTSMYEFMACCYGVTITVAYECLYTGLLTHVCCQFDILEHRFKTLNTNSVYTANHCVSHHLLIYKYADDVNEEFKTVLSYQFLSSTLLLCLTTYEIVYAENSPTILETWAFSMCVLTQMFYYCFYGDMVKTKSVDFLDRLFHSGWISWNKSTKMDLLMVMKRSRLPIEFTSMHIVTLNLESLMTVLKTSYSAFNLMSSTR